MDPGRRDRWVTLAIACSLVGWVLWVLLRPLCHPYADLACGNYTDHFSHMNTARVFTHAGLDIWREPLRELGRPLTFEEIADLPPDIRKAARSARAIPGWPADKPFLSSWSRNPRFHPPGELLVTAPVAAAYHFTSLSFANANRLVISLFLVFAHISLYVFFRALRQMEAGIVGFLGAFIVYGETVHLTLQGFYEAVIIGPLLLSALALRRRAGLAGTAWFTLAVFIHFRALFFLPLFAYGVYLVVTQREWKRWDTQSWIVAGATGVAGVMTLGVFVLLWPQLADIEINNPINLAVLRGDLDMALLYTGMLVLLSAVFLWADGEADLVVLIWIFVMLTLLRESYPWDVLTLLAWIGMPIVARRPALVRDVRIVALLFLALVVFDNESFPNPIWLLRVV